MLLSVLIALISATTTTNKEFELYDGRNSQFILAARNETLFFIGEEEAKIQKADTVFRISNDSLKMGFKHVCSDGVSGRVLRLCEYSNQYPEWKLMKQPNEYEMYEIRTTDGNMCAVYGPFENGERRIGVGSCQDEAIKFKLQEFDEYLTNSYNKEMREGFRFDPEVRTSDLAGATRYNPLIPEKLTTNV